MYSVFLSKFKIYIVNSLLNFNKTIIIETMMKKIFAVLAMTAGCIAWAGAKEKTDSLAEISGKILYEYSFYGAESLQDAYNANIMIVTNGTGKPDTLYTSTNLNGIFTFKKLVPQKIFMRISRVGSKTISGEYEIEAGQNAFFFTLEEAPEKIDESKVTADVPLMKQIKDTTIYNTAAVKTMDGETLRAALEQLPGFKVGNDKITVNGEEIKRTYVNGVLVFGDNPVVATDALLASEVSQVKVYDEQNVVDKRKGLKHSRKEKVLDVVTKEPILRLAEAGIAAGGGMDETGQARYTGSAAVAYHSEMLQVGATANTGNTSYMSGEQYLSSDSGFAVRKYLDAAIHFSDLTDYLERSGAKISIAKYWKDRAYGNSVEADYSYSHEYSKSASTVLQEYFANGANPATSSSDTSSLRSVRNVHNFNAWCEFNDTPIKSLRFVLTGKIDDGSNSSLAASKTITAGSGSTYYRHETTDRTSRDYDFFAALQWRNNDAVKFNPYAELKVTTGYNTNLSWTVDTAATSFDRRVLSSDGFGRKILIETAANFSNYLINDETRTLSLGYGIGFFFDKSKSKQLSVDEFGENGPRTDLGSTYDFSRNNSHLSVGANLSYNTRNMSLAWEVQGINETVMDDEYYPVPGYSSDKAYWTALSRVMFKYKNLSVGIDVMPEIPSVEQIRKRISDSNPLMLTGGNPDLKPWYKTSFKTSWYKTMGKGLYNLIWNLDGYCNFNQVVTKTEYFAENTVLDAWDGYTALAGSRLNTFENTSTPAWNIKTLAVFTGLFAKRKLQMQISTSVSYSSSPQYYGDNLIGVYDFSASGSINLNYRPVKQLKLSVNGNLNYVNSSNAGQLLSERIISRVSGNATVNFAKNGVFGLSYSMSSYDYLRGIGRDFMSHGLDAEIGWYFLKRTLNVSLHGIDLLDSGSVYTSTVTADSSTQTWRPVYGRYVMLTIKYLFRKK